MRTEAFPTATAAGLQWRDSFHTGFVLRCLMELESLDPAVTDAVRRGAAAYVRFFDRDGRATLWADRDASRGRPLRRYRAVDARDAVSPRDLSIPRC